MTRRHAILLLLKWIGILVLIFCGFNLVFTGSPVPLFKIEHLKNPVHITRIREDGLVASDGRLLHVRHVVKIPLGCAPLQEATANGVEISPDGYLIGRVRIHHWCGNDPVRYHLKRVNLSWLLILAGAETEKAIPESIMPKDRFGLSYGQYGLRINALLGMEMIESYARSEWAAEQPAGAAPAKPGPAQP